MSEKKTPVELRRTLEMAAEAATYSYMETSELQRALRTLHRDFGDAPSDLVLDLEKDITARLARHGIVNRYDDELAKAAGTYQETPPAPSLYELESYMGAVGLHPQAIRLVRVFDAEVRDTVDIYVEVTSPLLEPVKEAILRALQRDMPPRIVLKDIATAPATAGTEGGSGGVPVVGFVERYPTHSLVLSAHAKSDWESEISTLEYLTKSVQKSAMQASRIFKDAGGAAVPFNVCMTKASDDNMERVVTVVVLEPEVVDTTKDEEIESEGDIYSEEEIRLAMYWWMEHASAQTAYHHVEKGGISLTKADVVVLENWQTRSEQTIGNQTVPKGTWMATHRIKNDQLWEDILLGNIQGLSIGAKAMGALEEIPVN